MILLESADKILLGDFQETSVQPIRRKWQKQEEHNYLQGVCI